MGIITDFHGGQTLFKGLPDGYKPVSAPCFHWILQRLVVGDVFKEYSNWLWDFLWNGSRREFSKYKLFEPSAKNDSLVSSIFVHQISATQRGCQKVKLSDMPSGFLFKSASSIVFAISYYCQKWNINFSSFWHICLSVSQLSTKSVNLPTFCCFQETNLSVVRAYVSHSSGQNAVFSQRALTIYLAWFIEINSSFFPFN